MHTVHIVSKYMLSWSSLVVVGDEELVSRYVYTALQGGSIMHGWTNDERMMITCCNDGTRPVIFKIERIDIPESEEEKQWLEKKNFKNTAENAYTG